MLNLFGWIRRQVRDAVVGGIADAVEHVDGIDWSGTADDVRARLLGPAAPPALPPVRGDDDEERPATNGAARRAARK